MAMLNGIESKRQGICGSGNDLNVIDTRWHC